MGVHRLSHDGREPRFRDYVRIVAEGNADIVLNACSSIGELCAEVSRHLPQKIVRVDALMARTAIERGERIGVLATLPTTLRPTSQLIRDTPLAMGRQVGVDEALAEGAYDALMLGQRDRHDALISEALIGLVGRNDVVLLAQASMARVAATLPAAMADKVLASPSFAVDDVARALDGK